jgi:hypothetical protein
MKVVVTKQVKYRGKIYKPGEEFDAAPKDAKLLSRVTRLKDENDPTVDASRRGQYRRRDMREENEAAATRKEEARREQEKRRSELRQTVMSYQSRRED